jgi:hypothetical protein
VLKVDGRLLLYSLLLDILAVLASRELPPEDGCLSRERRDLVRSLSGQDGLGMGSYWQRFRGRDRPGEVDRRYVLASERTSYLTKHSEIELGKVEGRSES